jgi:hypothetical protein
MADEWDEVDDREPASWRVRRWAAPVALALSVALSVGAVRLLVDGQVSSAQAYGGDDRKPRFLLTAGRPGESQTDDGRTPWLEVRALEQGQGELPLAGSAAPPSPEAGELREIVPGPGGSFLVVSSRRSPCESRLYRFGLTDAGHVKKIERLSEDVIPALAAGLAMSPDGDRIAYTTAPCAADPQAPLPPATVTVLDSDSNRRRTWTATTPSLVGEIAWARDNRTLGYTLSDVQDAPSQGAMPGVPVQRTIGNATVHALDTGAQGADLGGGDILFRQPADSGTVTTAGMNPDGRTGYGVIERKQPASTVFFTFAEGEPMHVTRTVERKQNTVSLFVVSGKNRPRYACMGGVDAFGRVLEGGIANLQGSNPRCSTAWAY